MRVFGLLLMSTLLWALPAASQDTPVGGESTESADFKEASRRIRRLSDELRSPFCPGKTLMTCTSTQAYELRKEMRSLALQGFSDDEIVAEIQLRYGDQVSNPPQPWYTILVPFLPFLVMGLVVYFVFRRWKHGVLESKPITTDPALAGEDAARLSRLRAQVLADED